MKVTGETSIERERMVARQIAARGVEDPFVLNAMRAVQREEFVPSRLAEYAYEDGPLPIDHGQTISQPYIVAVMTAEARVRSGNRVLEIGTGSGYGAAVLSEIAEEVYTVERIADLADAARARLAALGYDKVHVRCGDGTLGWVEHAPYDAIIVTAGGPAVPPPLMDQLELGGRLVMPLGSEPRTQRLIRRTRTGPGTFTQDELESVCFVPLIGEQGWPER
jgi:protein-L-isoaspartate(D-aspartate) O-methyltransferase